MTGLSVDTLRAWERRYRVVEPARSARGRLYTDSDVKRFILLRTAVEKGYAIGQVAALPDSELDGLADRKDAAVPAPAPVIAVPPDFPETVMAAVKSFDSARVIKPPEFRAKGRASWLSV